MEEWKPVAGMEDRYEASSLGKVRAVWLKNGKPYGKIMSTSFDEHGYVKIYITVNGKSRCTRTHILVCKAFHGLPPTDLHTVNHKDGNKSNNVPENLEWMTRKEQAIHSYQILGNISKRPRGYGKHWRANYTDDEIKLIRTLHKNGMSYHKICNYLGNKTSWVSIQMIITGKTYNHVSD